ncbi:hypothetical protein B0T26DRAFT_239088 [Lasiosphaeria miniovina]|uniref:DRBM domain-containing protein n=1 Tax=Lasiosphaeria miniovina TaxID=1954250 RepID=A0AA40E3N4_9PEZI|nr:uncharacterized protein B0T26DRAFT_239088 [Lasiosphaeria miniovina]KAK0722886.1 hypothetical protein B0T26DRAFT_239088 [Lasiosphaeria miniovina]
MMCRSELCKAAPLFLFICWRPRYLITAPYQVIWTDYRSPNCCPPQPRPHRLEQLQCPVFSSYLLHSHSHSNPTWSMMQPKRKWAPIFPPQHHFAPRTPKRQKSNRTADGSISTMAAASSGSPLPAVDKGKDTDTDMDYEPVDYRDLKAWIAEQEALPQPAPLTEIQKEAIAKLRASLGGWPEPELGDTNWVGLLHRKYSCSDTHIYIYLYHKCMRHYLFFFFALVLGYRDAHQAGGAVVLFADEPAPQFKWVCHCTFRGTAASEPQQFPGPDGGLLAAADGSGGGALVAPSFARKKDAKQYAAKSCVEWLMAENRMPSDGLSVVFPKTKTAAVSSLPPPPPPHPPDPVSEGGALVTKDGDAIWAPAAITTATKKQKNKSAASPAAVAGNNGSNALMPDSPSPPPPPLASLDDDNTNDTIAAPLSPTPGQPPKKPAPTNTARSTAPTTIDVHDPSVPTEARVVEMCRRLGMAVPRYVVAQAEENATFFSARPNFGAADAVVLPDGLGVVRNIYSRRAAREAAAADVLAYLLRVERERVAEAEALIAELRAAVGVN